MFTARALDKHINAFLTTLQRKGFNVTKAILFGSYASGKPHAYSDIDLAVWLNNLPDEHYTEIPALVRIVTYYNPIRPRFYKEDETVETDAFIEIIKSTGKEIKLPSKLAKT